MRQTRRSSSRRAVAAVAKRPIWRLAALVAIGSLVSLLAGGLLAGCSDPPQLRMNAEETHGKVYYLDGIGCFGFGREEVPAGLRSAGYRGDVEYWSWSATHSVLDQLGDLVGAIHAKSRDLAKMIQMYRETYPGRPVSLIGLSAGTGVAVFACEQLPEGVTVDEVVLVASSLSERYNLTKALRHIRGNITLYQTQGDLALGVGAGFMGSIDRGFGALAGLSGFRPPDHLTAEERALYGKVKNIEYSPSFAAWGFNGDHTGAVQSPAFVRAKIAPIIMAAPCDPPGSDGRPAGPLSAGLLQSGRWAVIPDLNFCKNWVFP